MEERLKEAPCGFISIDQSGCINEVNTRFLTWMGYQEEEMVGKHMETLLTKVNRMFFHTYFFPTIQLHNSVEEFYINLTNAAGESIPVLLNARRYVHEGVPVIDCLFIQMKQRIDYELELRSLQKTTEKAYLDREEAFAQLEKVYVEIARKQGEILEMNNELLKLSNTDKLTNISNRRFFQKELERHIDLYTEEGIVFSLLMVDIDHFKNVNDTYGHLAGDSVLVQLAGLLTQEIGLANRVARLGGEEFVIILPGTNAEESLQLAVKLNKAVENANWEIIHRLTVSIGASTFSESDTEVTILNCVDQALYRAKGNGRNCSIHYHEIR
ncbi:diguanylate cyclase [Sporosarcina sp. BI001-red]|uniref:sensor domain-containing diguanylate cyclase n=1 Tax=Sporosarcina sp. BI001-red TaxID=2282866 RepID=UPI000E236096|nr:sensor domain-containing diguanylate cyclase [Sporosarcina sp. BI001-red]REB05485.1 diguanylate cyclase [Sporosarcina sp. BI001-red]